MADSEAGVATTAKGYEQPNPDDVARADDVFWEDNFKSLARFRKSVLVNLTVKYTACNESQHTPVSEEGAWSKTKPFLATLLNTVVSFLHVFSCANSPNNKA